MQSYRQESEINVNYRDLNPETKLRVFSSAISLIDLI